MAMRRTCVADSGGLSRNAGLLCADGEMVPGSRREPWLQPSWECWRCDSIANMSPHSTSQSRVELRFMILFVSVMLGFSGCAASSAPSNGSVVNRSTSATPSQLESVPATPEVTAATDSPAPELSASAAPQAQEVDGVPISYTPYFLRSLANLINGAQSEGVPVSIGFSDPRLLDVANKMASDLMGYRRKTGGKIPASGFTFVSIVRQNASDAWIDLIATNDISNVVAIYNRDLRQRAKGASGKKSADGWLEIPQSGGLLCPYPIDAIDEHDSEVEEDGHGGGSPSKCLVVVSTQAAMYEANGGRYRGHILNAQLSFSLEVGDSGHSDISFRYYAPNAHTSRVALD